MAIEAERDSRTVFAFNLPLRSYEDDLERFFGKAGKVRDIRLITDRITRKSKGVGYIEFFDKASIPAAIQLSGTQFMGQTIQVQQTQAEKNRMASTSTSSTVVTGPTKLYVGNLHLNIGEEELKKVFSSCGELEYVTLQIDPETRLSKGFGFVQFRKAEDARKALQQVNGIDIAGKSLKVTAVSEKQEQVLKGHITGDLDEDDSQASIRDAHSRAALMQKLAQQRGATTPPPPPPPSTTSPPRYSSYSSYPSSSTYNAYSSFTSVPTPCIVLKNMFDPARYFIFILLK